MSSDGDDWYLSNQEQYISFLENRSSQLDVAAQNALSLLKTNLVILGLFLPIVSTLLGSGFDPEKVFNSTFTQIGLIVWLLSVAALLIIYHYARSSSTANRNPQQEKLSGEISQEEFAYRLQTTVNEYANWPSQLNSAISVSAVLSLIATGLFALGVLSPYVSPRPSTLAIIIGGVVVLLAIVYYLIKRIIKYGSKIRNLIPGNRTKEWNELTEARKDVVRTIYDRVGTNSFRPRDFPTSSFEQMSGTLLNSENAKFSKYLLERLVEDGYYNKSGDATDGAVRTPRGRQISLDELEKNVENAIDRLGSRLGRHDEAKTIASRELGTPPNRILSEIRQGSTLDRVERYNRVVARLKDDDAAGTLDEYEFLENQAEYIPTELAEVAYKKIEEERRLERLRREHEEERAEREDAIRREENTYNFLVIESADKHGNIEVATHDGSLLGDDLFFTLNAYDVGATEEDIQDLLGLEVDDELRLRIDSDVRTGENYIIEAFC